MSDPLVFSIRAGVLVGAVYGAFTSLDFEEALMRAPRLGLYGLAIGVGLYVVLSLVGTIVETVRSSG